MAKKKRKPGLKRFPTKRKKPGKKKAAPAPRRIAPVRAAGGWHLAPGLTLLARFAPAHMALLRHEASPNPPARGSLRAPRLTPATFASYPLGTTEIVAAILDAGGRILGCFGWTGRGRVYFDRLHRERRGGLEGQTAIPWRDLRHLHLPIPVGSVFLAFYRSTVGPAGPGASSGVSGSERRLALQQRMVGLYLLPLAPGTKPPPIPPLPAPGPLPGPGPWPIPIPIVWPCPFPDFPPIKWIEDRFKRPYDPWPTRDGFLHSIWTLRWMGDTSDHFNIVILGDGFQEGELDIFDERATEVAEGLLLTEPFAGQADLINIFVVRAVSDESGITNVPVGSGTKRTYFKVAGDWQNSGYVGYLGTPNPEYIRDAASEAVPVDRIGMMITLANCDTDGGSGWGDLKMAFLPNHPLTPVTAVHEAGHAIADLAEEYIGGCPHDPLRPHPNQATEAERVEGAVPWLELATPSEKVDGRLKHEYLYPATYNASYGNPTSAPPDPGAFGVWWGCQDFDESDDPTCAADTRPYDDPRGRNFFRPASECRMRYEDVGFCRVCHHVIREKLQE